MANILVATNAAAGHTNPAVPIVSKLVERGHTVWWYTGKGFEAKVKATGAHFVAMSDSNADWSLIDPMDWLKQYKPDMAELEGIKMITVGMKLGFIDPAVGHLQDLQEILKVFPADVLLSDTLFVAAQFLHEKTGLPYAKFGEGVLAINSRDTAPFGPALPPDASFMGRVRNHFLNFIASRVLMREINQHYAKTRAAVGLPKQDKPFFETLISPYLLMQGTVPSFEYPRSDQPAQVHFVGPFLPPPSSWTPPVWWEEVQKSRRPVIHVTQGTINKRLTDLVVPSIQALANEDVLVVVTTGGEEKVPSPRLPANVRVADFIPHVHLLPLVDLMITNGGYGAVQNALSHGIPLIVAGTTEDKPEVAARVAWGGVGINLKTRTPNIAQLKAAVQQIETDPRYRQKAQQIAAEMREHNPPLEAALLLEELIATKRPVLASSQKEVASDLYPAVTAGMLPSEGYFHRFF